VTLSNPKNASLDIVADLIFTDSPDGQITFNLPDGNNAGMSVTMAFYAANKIENTPFHLPGCSQVKITTVSNRVLLHLNILQGGPIKVVLYGPDGRMVALLADQTMSKGRHVIPVKVGGLASGVYLVCLETGKQKILKKTVIFK
jgi:hypothetical protein